MFCFPLAPACISIFALSAIIYLSGGILCCLPILVKILKKDQTPAFSLDIAQFAILERQAFLVEIEFDLLENCFPKITCSWGLRTLYF